MILRVLLFCLILCGLAGFGTIAWLMIPQGSAPAAAAAAAPHKVAVLTVTQSLRPGMLLKPEDLESSDVEQDRLPAGYVLSVPDARRGLVGGLVRRPLSSGDVLRLPGDALRPADHGFLAAVLSPGTRAVTVGVDMISGAAGLIWPGDRVDLILTQSIDDQNVAPGRRVAAETVLRDVRVIAIDQQIAEGGTQNVGDTGNIAKTVTLEVTPNKAEFVQVAAKLGHLSLTLRAAEAGPVDTSAPVTVWGSDVSSALPAEPPRTVPGSMHVFQGSGDPKEFKF